MQISTLRRIVQALGGELEVIAKFPKGTVKLEQFDGRTHPARSRHRATDELQFV